MDRTKEFSEIVRNVDSSAAQRLQQTSSCSPFVLKASNLLRQWTLFDNLLQSVNESYIGYNRFLSVDELGGAGPMSASERLTLDREVLSFVATMAAEVKDLSRMVDADSADSLQFQHNKLVVSFLLNKLSSFTARSERMQKRQKALNISPFRLLSSLYADADPNNDELARPSTPDPSSSSSSVVNASFAHRYVDEIAPASKMREYTQIAATHKESLLKEAKLLQVRFRDDLQESRQMERQVGGISSLLSQFVAMIETQSELVADINDSAKLATSSVKQAGAELQQTIERTQSHQWSMVILVALLAALILLLDALTP